MHVTDIADHELHPSEDTTPEEQHDPHQFDDAPDSESDPVLDYINSQHHQEEDMNNALQAYKVMTSPTSDTTPQQSINSVHIHLFYHVAQDKPSMVHLLIGEPMVDLQGQMSESSPNPPGNALLLVLTNTRSMAWILCNELHWYHAYVNLIMNEYAYYGKGHTIHSSGQIEWHKNQVDDKSVKVGGTQCITTLDGYSFPLKCRGGLMYLSILGKPTDEELVKYPSVHLTSIHEWDPSVLDFSYPEGDGEPVWACDPQHLDLLDPNFDPHGLYTKRANTTLSSLADVQPTSSMVISPSKTPFQANKHQIKSETPEFDKYKPYIGWVNADTIRDTFKHTTQWGASIGTFPMKKASQVKEHCPQCPQEA